MQAKKTAINEKLKELQREAEERDAQRRAQKSGYSYLDARTAPINIEALALIPEEKAFQAKVAAIEIKEQGQKILLTVFDPLNAEAKEIFKNLEVKGYKILINIVSLSSLRHIFSFYKFVSKEAGEITGSIQIEEAKLLELSKKLTTIENIKKSLLAVNREDIYTSDLLEIVMAGALATRASDIHLEPEENHTKLRLRIDGLLHDVFDNLKSNVYLYLLSRIKLLSGLKLNIHDEAQDGRFTVKFFDEEIEIRVSVAPAEFGEVVVMRILDPKAININLSELGLRKDDLEVIEVELKRPNGMILNTGPTGSGKTTTLYSFLQHKKSSEVKIITIEDPIEYQIEGIEQTQVNEEAGYTFGSGLKSLMRQDPDIILVGEIRDKETAEIGIQSALTGHLVFSTVHANEAAGAIPRLLDLGVRASSIGPALNLIIAQRLVRRLCGFCKTGKDIEEDLTGKIKKLITSLPPKVDKKAYKEIKVYNPKGCDKCGGFGYNGRIGIYELLLIGPEMEDLIDKETNEAALQEFAVRAGMVTMQQDGILKVAAGITSLEEVESATGPIGWPHQK